MPHRFARPILVLPTTTGADLDPVYRRSGLQLTERRGRTSVTLELAGEMDIMGASLLPAVVDRVAGLGPTTICLDFSRLVFCDCAGLNALIDAHDVMNRHRGFLVVARMRPHVRRLLTLTGLDHELVVVDDDVDDVALGLVAEDDGPEGMRRRA